jgi:hypothetical protein
MGTNENYLANIEARSGRMVWRGAARNRSEVSAFLV